VSDRKRLVELKARYEDAAKARSLLAGSNHVGTFRQTDTYFSLGERRLKLREIVGRPSAQLIYYERPDEAGVRESEVLLYEAADPGVLKEMLSRAFGVRVVVRKQREIYRQKGVQVHVDDVERLGHFLEFELAVEDAPDAIEAGRAELGALQRVFGIPDEDLVASSYSDLLAD